MVNIAIIGCGSITFYRHAPECKKVDCINIAGFYDINEARSEEFAKLYGGKAYKSYDEVLSDENVDGVIVCTANKYHCEMTVQALKSGKNVLCEKPISVTLDEAQKMIDTAKESEKILMIAHSQRYDAVNRKLKEILNSGRLGRIISFRTVFGHRGPETWSVDKGNATWFLNRKEAGLGALGDIGIHKADLIHWLINDDIEYITARTATLDKKLSDGTKIGVEDNAFCVLESNGGIIGTLEASWTHYGKDDNFTNIYCENGIIEADSNADEQIKITMRDGSSESLKVNECDSDMAKTFAECIENNTEPELSGEEGKKALQIVLKCIESSETGKRVRL